MIKLKDILKEIEAEQEPAPARPLMMKWHTPGDSPDEVVNVTHQLIAKIMEKIGSNNELYVAHYIKSQRMDEGTWAVWNPSTNMMLKYTKRGGIWELVMPGDAVGRMLSATDLENIIAHWMR